MFLIPYTYTVYLFIYLKAVSALWSSNASGYRKEVEEEHRKATKKYNKRLNRFYDNHPEIEAVQIDREKSAQKKIRQEKLAESKRLKEEKKLKDAAFQAFLRHKSHYHKKFNMHKGSNQFKIRMRHKFEKFSEERKEKYYRIAAGETTNSTKKKKTVETENPEVAGTSTESIKKKSAVERENPVVAGTSTESIKKKKTVKRENPVVAAISKLKTESSTSVTVGKDSFRVEEKDSPSGNIKSEFSVNERKRKMDPEMEDVVGSDSSVSKRRKNKRKQKVVGKESLRTEERDSSPENITSEFSMDRKTTVRTHGPWAIDPEMEDVVGSDSSERRKKKWKPKVDDTRPYGDYDLLY